MILFVWKEWNNLREQANAMISKDPLPYPPPTQTMNKQQKQHLNT